MLQATWNNGLLRPADGWSADPATRYEGKAVVQQKEIYSNPTSKRLFRGSGATPERLLHAVS